MKSAVLLAEEIREIERRRHFDRSHWQSLKSQIAITHAFDLACVIAKLGVVVASTEPDVTNIDADILRSAIADLERLQPAR